MSDTKKAFLISIALHLVLLLALAALRPHFDPGIGASPRYVEVAVLDAAAPLGSTVPADTSADTPASTDSPPRAPAEDPGALDARASDAPAPVATPDGPTFEPPAPPAPPPDTSPVELPPVPVEIRRAAAPITAAQPPSSAGPPEPSNPPAPSAIPETLASSTSAPPPQRSPEATTTPAPVIVTDAVPERPADALPDPLVAMAPKPPPYPLPDPLPDPVDSAALQRPPAAPPAPVLRPPSEPIASGEAELIEARVEHWARRFAALGRWETATTWADRDVAYSAEVARLPSADGTGYDEAIVTVTTERNGQTFSTELRLQRLGFSHYAQLIDRWDPHVQIHDDQIEGRFHSNTEIFVGRSGGVQPTFLGKVTTAKRVNTSLSDRSIRRSQVFLGGLEERAGRITLPKTVPLAADAADAAADSEAVLRLPADAHIEFLARGALRWTPLETEREAPQAVQPPAQTVAFDPAEPFYVVASEDASVYVRGTVNGKILVYSPEDIVIEGNLVYAAHPLENPDSDDYLGLVAEKSVDVGDPEMTGPGDLEIHAAIYARRRFAVRDYRKSNHDLLTIIGSVTAGTLTASEPRFATSVKFDPRLMDTRPPRFPVTDRYEIAGWDGRWSVASDPKP